MLEQKIRDIFHEAGRRQVNFTSRVAVEDYTKKIMAVIELDEPDCECEDQS